MNDPSWIHGPDEEEEPDDLDPYDIEPEMDNYFLDEPDYEEAAFMYEKNLEHVWYD